MKNAQSKSTLLKSIYATAKKLGADVSSQRSLPKRVHDCPNFIAEFYQRIVWPKRHEFMAPNFDDIGLTGISFGSIQPVPSEQDVDGDEGKNLYGFGTHDGGNWILMFDGNERRRANPMVYCVDHEPYNPLEQLCRLDEFLKLLQTS